MNRFWSISGNFRVNEEAGGFLEGSRGETPGTRPEAWIRTQNWYQLTLIRAQGQASITSDSGRPAVYQQIKKLCQRLESKAEILTARMVLSARLPVFEGVKAADIVTVFKDMALMGKGILAKAKRSLGLVIDSVIDDGSGGSDGTSPDPGGGTNDCGFHGGSPLPDQHTPIQVAPQVDHIELETAETAGNCWEDKQQLESNNRKAYSSSTQVLSLPFNRHSSFSANIKMKMNGGQGLKGVSSGKKDETQNSIFRPERQAGWC